MEIKKYLEENQPNIFRLLTNATKLDTFSQAYLISGSFGSPVLDIAIFFAKTIFCKNKNPLACLECENCRKIDNGSFMPLIVIDGEKKTILKEDIQNIESLFSSTSLEKSNKYAYIVNLAENMTQESTNALLKFLEEPNENVYGIITTKNISKVLPTIISRCQVLTLKDTNKSEEISLAINQGVSKEDAELLSFIYPTVDEIVCFSKEKEFQTLKKCLIEYLTLFIEDTHSGRFYMESKIIPSFNTKETQRLFVDILNVFLLESIKCTSGLEYTLKGYETLLNAIYNKIANIENVIVDIYEIQKQIDFNVNGSALLLEIDRLLGGELINYEILCRS